MNNQVQRNMNTFLVKWVSFASQGFCVTDLVT